MENSSRLIQLTVISAEGLLVNRRSPAKKTVSITVKTDPINSRSTSVHDQGRAHLTWNENMVMDLPATARYITVEAKSGARVIGSATIPVSEFCGGYLPDNYLSFLSYRLRGINGDKNGIVNLSVKVIKGSGNGTAASGSGCATSCSRPWMGVPTVDNKVSCGVVTGIPVSYKC